MGSPRSTGRRSKSLHRVADAPAQPRPPGRHRVVEGPDQPRTGIGCGCFGGRSPWQESGLGQVSESTPAVEFRTLNGMAMGKNPAARQAAPIWVNTEHLPTSSGHPFFERPNGILAEARFDTFAKGLCAAFDAERPGRPSFRRDRYFR